MPKPGALIPSIAVNFTLGSSANARIPQCAAVMLDVTTAGTLGARYRNNPNNDVILPVAVGIVTIPGDFLEMWSIAPAVITVPAVALNS